MMGMHPMKEFALRMHGFVRQRGLLLKSRALTHGRVQECVFGTELPEDRDFVDARFFRDAPGSCTTPTMLRIDARGGVENSVAMVLNHTAG